MCRVGYAFGLPSVLLALWWVTSAGSTNFYFPPLSEILDRLAEQWFGARLVDDVVPSLLRLAAGYAVAAVLGIAAGVLIGLHERLRSLLEPVMQLFRAIPSPLLVPIVMVLFGIENTMKIAVIAGGCVWPILLNTVEGVRAVDEV